MTDRIRGTLGVKIRPPLEAVPAALAFTPAKTSLDKPSEPLRRSAAQRAIDARIAGDLDRLDEITAEFSAADGHEYRRSMTDLALRWLKTAYPHLFGTPSQPLKVGIRKDLQAVRPPYVSSTALSSALAFWTKQPAYKRAVEAGVERRGVEDLL